ncbi:CPBP family intramembrane glutamic endopeptidase [Massilia endophytica]|uniref:CPBP family intramembrane glutamic endopeptidase n=1 Tax=Massilia endophytica TaxID=2899220 RepID=UPI001E47510A|nr:CPBP family intramembrane glutamic endopeptidase [Massilia endophytica]UGQ46905.1 CPBP family intramembrane metalloprotease [Massilia endophytica]
MLTRRPVLAAIFCAGLQFLITTLILKAGSAFMPPEAFGKVKLAAFASTVILPLILVQVFGLWRQVGLELDKLKPGGVFFASMLLCVLFLAMGVHPQETRPFAPELLIQFINAFGEELLFRGVIFAILLSLPRWQAIAISGILFGGMHLIHGFMDGDWNHAMWWAAATSLSGMMFAAVRYGTGSLWLTIVLHMVLNLCKIYSNIEAAAGPAALLIAERAAYGIEIALIAYVILSARAGARVRMS